MSRSPSSPPTDNWSIEEAKRTYHIDRWGLGYFDIDQAGRVVARPRPDNGGATIRLTDIIDQTRERNLRTPLLIRFQDILRHRVQTINAAFAKAPGQGDDYLVDHTANVVLVNEYGHYHGFFRAPLDAGRLKLTYESIRMSFEG